MDVPPCGSVRVLTRLLVHTQVAALSPCSDMSVPATRDLLSPYFQEAYGRVIDNLLGAGCEFRCGVAVHGGESGEKMIPLDRDICLSLYDSLTPAPTKTKALNVLSNRVARTMLYGDDEDVSRLVQELVAGRPSFLQEWTNGHDNGDEALYYDSLIVQLQGGLDAAIPRLRGGYGNAYQRLMTLLVKELGSRSAPVNGEVFDSFVRWETSLRRNLTEPLWDPHPRELNGQWTLFDGTMGGFGAPSTGTGVGVATVIFTRDGAVRVPGVAGMGGAWRLEPGPTHLDTIHFHIVTNAAEGRVLAYTGYIDRGQRIETRFSKRPIKMQGRLVVKSRGEARSSSKFSMELPRSKKPVLRVPIAR
jgi:hypothetical protein